MRILVQDPRDSSTISGPGGWNSSGEILIKYSSYNHSDNGSRSVLHVLSDATQICMKYQLYIIISMIFIPKPSLLDIFLYFRAQKIVKKSRVEFQNAVKWKILDEISNFRIFSVSTLNLLQNGFNRLFLNDFNFARKLILHHALWFSTPIFTIFQWNCELLHEIQA